MATISNDVLDQVERVSLDPNFQLTVENNNITSSPLPQTVKDHFNRAQDVSHYLRRVYTEGAIDPELAQRTSYVFYSYFRTLSRALPEHKETLIALSLNARFGYTLDFGPAPASFKQFILANHLHHIFPALNISLHQAEIPLYVEGKGLTMIPWENLEVKPPSEGAIFYYEGQPIFEVDEDYELSPRYSITEWGICKAGAPLLPLKTRNRSIEGPEGNYDYVVKVVITELKSADGSSSIHTSLVLKDPEKIFTFSNGGKDDDLLTPMNQGLYHSPDTSILVPPDKRDLTEATFYVSQETFLSLKHRLEQDLITSHRGEKKFNIFNENCTTYARDIMQDHLGLTPVIETDLLKATLLEGFPQTTALCRKIYAKIPFIWIFKPMIVIPYYFASVTLGIGSKILDRTFDIQTFSWKQIFTQNCQVSYPPMLAAWLKKNCPQPIDLRA